MGMDQGRIFIRMTWPDGWSFTHDFPENGGYDFKLIKQIVMGTVNDTYHCKYFHPVRWWSDTKPEQDECRWLESSTRDVPHPLKVIERKCQKGSDDAYGYATPFPSSNI